MNEGLDLVALWVGRIVMGISTGVCVTALAAAALDNVGRRTLSRLQAIHTIARIRAAADKIRMEELTK